MQKTWIILDFETTGVDPATSEIIEIGAVKMQGIEKIGSFHSLVKPDAAIPNVIQKLTGITDAMVADAPGISEVVLGFLDFLGDSPIVAHHSALEKGFLDRHVAPFAQRAEFNVENSIDALALIIPESPSHSMETMRKWAGVDSENAHRADKDAEDCLKILTIARERLFSDRKKSAEIVRKLLGKNHFWSFFFENEEKPEGFQLTADESLEVHDWPALLKRESQGDLKEMRSLDSSREIDWSKSVELDDIHAALAAGSTDSGFQHRDSQEKMATEIAVALNDGERIAIEAPTGTGKSVAYLVPGVLAAEKTGAPLVVSTHSKSLQDQLLEKDIPLVRKLLNRPDIKATTVKGQDNYLCLRKTIDVLDSISDESSDDERWAAAYLGSLASLGPVVELDRVSPYLRGQHPSLDRMIDEVRSHHTTTIGPSCPYYESCHFFDSARIAHQSQVIIANHALVFQWPAHLPQVRNIIFDEAHHLEDRITEAYSIRVSEDDIRDTIDRLVKKRGGSRRTFVELNSVASCLDQLDLDSNIKKKWESENPKVWIEDRLEGIKIRLSELRNLVPTAMGLNTRSARGNSFEASLDPGFGMEQSFSLNPVDKTEQRQKQQEPLLVALSNLRAPILEISEVLTAASKLAISQGKKFSKGGKNANAYDTLQLHAQRFDAYQSGLEAVLAESAQYLRLIFWNPRESTWRIWIAPIEVAELSQPFFAAKRSVVLTSATLSHGAQNSFVTDRIGLPLSKPLTQLPSPYDLMNQSRIFAASDIAQPGTPSHLEALIDFTEQSAKVLEGRTLLLITSNKRLKQAAETLREKLEPRGIQVFDSLTDRRAAENFRAAERAVLVGGERYGEGLDIPGAQLSCVIIEKINEAMTRGPLAEARKARTRFALFDYDFPLRLMWLKQRVGRLIRSTSDTGVVVVFDPRYSAWSPSSRQIVQKALLPVAIHAGPREKILDFIQNRFKPGQGFIEVTT
ncbi:MAG: hypothetical protein JNL01_01980 [Bdellovibrionales bacterium]|nr:hypothetical protein [Bdellovibrionales bacterium]